MIVDSHQKLTEYSKYRLVWTNFNVPVVYNIDSSYEWMIDY